MELFKSYISGLLGLLMVVAVLLPSLHALNHDLNDNEIARETNVIPAPFDCELCDFHFSSLDIPEYQEFNESISENTAVYSFSISENIYLFPHNQFSLRAPPAVIA